MAAIMAPITMTHRQNIIRDVPAMGEPIALMNPRRELPLRMLPPRVNVPRTFPRVIPRRRGREGRFAPLEANLVSRELFDDVIHMVMCVHRVSMHVCEPS